MVNERARVNITFLCQFSIVARTQCNSQRHMNQIAEISNCELNGDGGALYVECVTHTRAHTSASHMPINVKREFISIVIQSDLSSNSDFGVTHTHHTVRGGGGPAAQ